MAISQLNQSRAEFALAQLRTSDLSAALKEDLAEVLSQALSATNGLSDTEKIQALSESNFNLTRLFVLNLSGTGRHTRSWKDVLVECRWQLTIVAIAAAVVAVFHPEIAAVIVGGLQK